jgi:hypothetical protein
VTIDKALDYLKIIKIDNITGELPDVGATAQIFIDLSAGALLIAKCRAIALNEHFLLP